jgi:multicomponent Na+:H+ antiporter subunit G
MSAAVSIASGAFVVAGIVFLGISAVGVMALDGFFSRAHAVAKSETLGIILVLGGLAMRNGFADGTLQLLVVIVIAMVANPTAVHALARAAAARAEDDRAAGDAAGATPAGDAGEPGGRVR